MGGDAEVRSHLYVALDQGYMNKGDFDRAYAKAQIIGKLIGGFIAYLQQEEQSKKSS